MGRNTWTERQVKVFDDYFSNLQSGNIEAAVGLSRFLDPNFAPLASRMAQEYGNLGGVSPETMAMVEGFTQPKAAGRDDYTTQKNFALYPKVTKQFKEFASTLPVVSGGTGDRQVQLYAKPEDMSVGDFMRYQAFNQALGYVDPTTKATTQQYLARENPFLFRGYANAPTASPEGVQQYTPEQLRTQLNQAAEGLDYNKLYANLPQTAKKQVGAADQGESQSAIRWLQDYLKTAASGVGGTRAQKQFAAERLSTLDREAEGKGDLANWATLAQNIVNPAQQRRMGTELIGQSRSVNQPFGAQYNRGGFLRNVRAT